MSTRWGQLQYETEILSDKEKTRPKTYKTYDKLWRRIRALIGKIHCDCWTREDSKKLAAKFKHLSGIYANTGTTLVANLFALAVEKDWIEEPPNLIRRKTKTKQGSRAQRGRPRAPPRRGEGNGEDER